MYLSIIIRHTLMSSLSRSKNFILRSFRNLSLKRDLVGPKPNILDDGTYRKLYSDPEHVVQ
jgi:hypothetical protein